MITLIKVMEARLPSHRAKEFERILLNEPRTVEAGASNIANTTTSPVGSIFRLSLVKPAKVFLVGRLERMG